MKYVAIAGVVLLVVFLVVLAFIPLGIEPLTEVYFENHTQLPNIIQLDKTYNYSFTIHNLEHQKMRYTYSVDMYSEEGEWIDSLGSDEIILLHDEMVKVDNVFNFGYPINRTKIVVNVTKDLSLETPKFKNKLWWPDPNYPMNVDIHFWIQPVEGTSVIIK